MYLFPKKYIFSREMVNNHPPIATPFNNFCPKTLSNLARDKKVFEGFIRPIAQGTSR